MADAWRMDFKFLTTVDPEQFFAEKRLVKHITNTDNEYFDRILNADRGVLQSSNYFAYHEIPMMFGYHGNQMKIYDQYWFRIGKSNDHSFIYRVTTDEKAPPRGELTWLNFPFIGMAGVKYIVCDYQTEAGRYLDSLRLLSTPAESQRGGLVLYENPQFLGRAWVYHDWQVVPDRDAALRTLREMKHDWRTTAILEKEPTAIKPVETEGFEDKCEIALYENNRIEIRADLKADGLVYLADCYYPAWKAYVDGQREEILLANGAFRPVPVPAGNHKIEFKYESEIFAISSLTTCGGLLFVAGSIVIALMRGRKERETELERESVRNNPNL